GPSRKSGAGTPGPRRRRTTRVESGSRVSVGGGREGGDDLPGLAPAPRSRRKSQGVSGRKRRPSSVHTVVRALDAGPPEKTRLPNRQERLKRCGTGPAAHRDPDRRRGAGHVLDTNGRWQAPSPTAGPRHPHAAESRFGSDYARGELSENRDGGTPREDVLQQRRLAATSCERATMPAPRSSISRARARYR